MLEANGLEQMPTPGQFIGLEPCMRICPRVELLPENSGAAALAMLAVSPSPTAARLMTLAQDAYMGHLDPDGKQRVFQKVARAAQSDAVVEFQRRTATAWQKSD